MAAKLAKEQGWAINVGGGFHHCSAGKGGGFCAYADISLCIHYAFIRLNISRYWQLKLIIYCSVRISILNCYLHIWDLVFIICEIVQGDDN